LAAFVELLYLMKKRELKKVRVVALINPRNADIMGIFMKLETLQSHIGAQVMDFWTTSLDLL